jgi:hypothetical protein
VLGSNSAKVLIRDMLNKMKGVKDENTQTFRLVDEGNKQEKRFNRMHRKIMELR